MKAAGIRWLVVVGLTLGIAGASALWSGEAGAESNQGRGLDLLSRAMKSYETEDYSDAAAELNSAFKAGLTGETAARAILLRAEINEKNGEPAKALQDYSNAAWMENLPPEERKAASEGKERVMASMGLSSPGPSGSPEVGRASASAQQSGNSSGGVLGFFSGIFGGSEDTSAPPPQEEGQQASQPSDAAAAAPASAPAKEQKTASKAAAKQAKIAHAKPHPAEAASSDGPASALSVTSAPGGILIVFGSASNEASGHSAAKNIKAQLSDILINRQLDVAPRAGGGFQIQAGPYKAKSSAIALCSAIRQRGIQCQVAP